MRKLKILFTVILVFPILFSSVELFASQGNIIDLKATFSENGKLFDLENLKPGDWADRHITVSNQTNNDITYEIDVRYLDGSEMLYNQLSLEIKQGDVPLFHDNLSAFSLLTDLSLAADSEERIDLSVTFPPESGNEFQGLTTSAEIIITAYHNTESESSSLPISTGSQSDGGKTLPGTATMIVNILLIGGTLLIVGLLTLLYLKRRKLTEE
ncbi:hypothetical protein ACTNEO_16340 [Gracilibacillus sp. HCP3S3_G5_1]|uniref:hypothetical protein n=1 Tax=unclassified Gracilibacillus TaxID=2625209 RepID=UPI003F8C2305